jgi:2,5-diamino-6-(ribosylamino)-4(3H)-pyrimidinone 5'-phosphate reductase
MVLSNGSLNILISKNSMKPYVICHMLGSVDGRIKQDIWGFKNHHKYFEETAEQIEADAWLVGRITMQEFSSKETFVFNQENSTILKEDFVAEQPAKAFAVVIDPSGKCFWDTNMVSTEHVIEVLSEQVTEGYLQHLREKNVSYIFAGKQELDLELALQKLYRLFNIKTLRIDGGGHVNGSFLKAGLIDEFSLVLAPLADGTIGAPTVFEVEKSYKNRKATQFTLKSVERIYDDFLWIRYLAVKGNKPER